jgi:hypothetical protein
VLLAFLRLHGLALPLLASASPFAAAFGEDEQNADE